MTRKTVEEVVSLKKALLGRLELKVESPKGSSTKQLKVETRQSEVDEELKDIDMRGSGVEYLGKD